MKMKVFDKIINVLLLFCVIGFGVLCLGVAWGVFIPDLFERFGAMLTGGTVNAAIVTVIFVVVLFLCLRILFVRKREGGSNMQHKAGVQVRAGENGSVFVTAEAIEDLVLRQVRTNVKVRDCSCELALSESSVAVRLHLFLAPDANIPETTAALQADLKEHIESMTGIGLPEIQCIVEKQPQPQADNRLAIR